MTAIAGTTRDALNKIMDPARGGLRTPVPAAPPGTPRIFSRENGLEIVFILALGNVGMPSSLARRFAYAWVERVQSSQLTPYWAWNPRASARFGPEACQLEFADPIPFQDLAFMLSDGGPGEFDQPAATLVVIDRKELVTRVDAAVAS
jgi:hypothetical protein